VVVAALAPGNQVLKTCGRSDNICSYGGFVPGSQATRRNMNPDALLSVVAIIINVELGLFVISRGPRQRVNRIFLAITAMLTIWGVGELVMRTASTSSVVLLGAKISTFGWAFIGPVFVHFTLAITDRDALLKKWWIYVMLYAPGAALLAMTLWTKLIYVGFGPKSQQFLERSGSLRLYSKLFVFVMLLIGVVILVTFWRRSSDPIARERAGFVTIAALVPIVGASFTDLLIPAINVRQPVNTLTFSVITAAIIAYAVTRRGIMSTRLAAVGGTIISMIRDPVFILDPAGNIDTVNAMAGDFTGYSQKELLGSTMEKLLAEKDREHHLTSRLSDSLEISETTELVLASGESVPVTISSGPLLQHSGKQIGSVVMIHDLRQTMALLRAEEEARLALIEADIQRQHSQTLRDVIDVAAHELLHPATIFKGYADVLKNFWEKLGREKIDESLAAIDATADRLTGLAATLNFASYIESGTMRLDYEEVQPLMLIEARIAKNRVLHPDNVFVFESGIEDLTIRADPDKIESVLGALIDNAVKFSPEGSRVDIGFERVGNEAIFSVADRGSGIPHQQKQQVFERFHQVDDILHHSLPGMGLGLFIAKSVVDAHDGWIKVEARDGGGSIFTFGIPTGVASRRGPEPIPEEMVYGKIEEGQTDVTAV
jgi:PAS domain S-box-containing protein